MIYSDKELAQLVIAYCASFQVEHIVISPGSRNAPLTIGFTNQKSFTCYSIVDERSAGFFALGLAQQLRKPVAVVCTSGSALLNYYPAVAEAFYSDIPLVVVSADRPQHLIDIGDGQTIRQEYVLEKHTLFNANLSEGAEFETSNKNLLSSAFKKAIEYKGPIHINVPFDEPLYETTTQLKVKVSLPEEDSQERKNPDCDFKGVASVWNNSKRKMILVGSNYPDKKLQQYLDQMTQDESVLILTETTSNLYHDRFINNIDQLIFSLTEEELVKFQPEILISLGGMIVSKKIKEILRKYQPKHHWHLDEKKAYNTYHCLSKHVKVDPVLFFENFKGITRRCSSDYANYWLQVKSERQRQHNAYLNSIQFSDLKVFEMIFQILPKNIQLQLSNSSVVRYAQLFTIDKTIEVFCNRGTSGIDGSTSTAIGAAKATEKQTVLISGDLSFFYDSNALWNSYLKRDFRIILVNNGGGGIFRFIPGPTSTNALDYFETPHSLTAEQLCKMYGLEYQSVANEVDLNQQLVSFFSHGNAPKLLEVFTQREVNDKLLKDYFKNL